MNSLAWIGLGVFAVCAGADWIAVGRGARTREYVWKPATLAALVLVAVALDPADDARRAWFVAALALSLAGDVFLMLPSDRFVAGLASFLLAHVAYTVGLNIDGGSAAALALAAAVVATIAVPLGRRIVTAAARHDRRLGLPVAVYVVAISAMVVSAGARGAGAAVVGAVLFYASDAFIGWSRFVRAFRHHRLAIMVTYHLGQAGLVVSLLSHA